MRDFINLEVEQKFKRVFEISNRVFHKYNNTAYPATGYFNYNDMKHIDDWIKEQDCTYTYNSEYYSLKTNSLFKVKIVFYVNATAVLFKLTWCENVI